ncbi:MAG: 2-phospho-L-lactate transferase CofD family protein, partial [Acidimicrobiales bacterium]|nr:2-phospho-L-lactate transferase CofD family protein [Acidimicrobiales bacterium]
QMCIRDRSWTVMEALERYGGITWFRLGDRDLATHLYRTQRLCEGADLATVTAEIARAWDVAVKLLPVTNDRLRTMVTIVDEGEVSFQDYFVRRRHAVAVRSVRFDGEGSARAAPGVLEALADAAVVVIAPSNPIVSIGPLLAVSGIRSTVAARRDRNVAVSPIVAGQALKGPADRLLAELGHEPSALGIARLYRELAATLVIDEADRDLADAIEAEGVRCIVAPTVMHTPEVATALARTVLDAAT